MVMKGMTIVPLRVTSITALRSHVALVRPLYACLYKETTGDIISDDGATDRRTLSSAMHPPGPLDWPGCFFPRRRHNKRHRPTPAASYTLAGHRLPCCEKGSCCTNRRSSARNW